jgi:hypothetical protein
MTEETTILIKAEAFDDLGELIIDQQFMVEKGFPFLFAHGLCCLVADSFFRELDFRNLIRGWN